MSKHRYGARPANLWGLLKYPLPIYKHWFLNNWNYFTKPKLSAKITDYKQKIKGNK